jgi:tetratricopeptide (TPR) repeat protein
MGHHDDAIATFVKGVELSGRASFYLANLGWGLARAGQSGKARAILGELSERAKKEYVAPLHLAMIVSALGDMDRAFELLDEAVEKRNSWLAVPRMHLFDAFRDDPRFDEHLKRIDHPDRPPTS